MLLSMGGAWEVLGVACYEYRWYRLWGRGSHVQPLPGCCPHSEEAQGTIARALQHLLYTYELTLLEEKQLTKTVSLYLRARTEGT